MKCRIKKHTVVNATKRLTQVDPTRTLSMRRLHTAKINKQFALLKGLIIKWCQEHPLTTNSNPQGINQYTVGSSVSVKGKSGFKVIHSDPYGDKNFVQVEKGGKSKTVHKSEVSHAGDVGSDSVGSPGIARTAVPSLRKQEVLDKVPHSRVGEEPSLKDVHAAVGGSIEDLHKHLLDLHDEGKVKLVPVTRHESGLLHSEHTIKQHPDGKGGYLNEFGYVRKLTENQFCPTGAGGGVDPSCSRSTGMMGENGPVPNRSFLQKALHSAREMKADFTEKLDKITDVVVVKQIKQGLAFAKGLQSKFTGMLLSRYGRTAQLAILASSQIVGTGAMSQGIVIPASVVWGSIPGVAIAEGVLQASRLARSAASEGSRMSAEGHPLFNADLDHEALARKFLRRFMKEWEEYSKTVHRHTLDFSPTGNAIFRMEDHLRDASGRFTSAGVGTFPNGDKLEFIPHETHTKHTETIMVDINKLDSAWHDTDRIPPGVHDSKLEVAGQRERLREYLKTGGQMRAIEPAGMEGGKIRIADGRHRMSELRDMGIDKIGITVARDQVNWWNSKFGETKAPETVEPKREEDKPKRGFFKRLLGLNTYIITTNDDPPYHWAASSSQEKLEGFQQWLKTQVNTLLVGKSQEALWREYIHQGWKKGVARSFDDLNKAKPQFTPEQQQFYAGSRDQFLHSSFNQPVAREKVELLASRTFDEMENVTDDMANRMSRVLADGMVQGKGPHEVAKDLTGVVDFSRQRAEVVARTELMKSHNEGQLTAMEQLGVQHVGVEVEWLATPDERTCPICADMEGSVFTIDEAHGLLPRHPMCRCCFVPNVEGA